jgi:hypothetical protein
MRSYALVTSLSAGELGRVAYQERRSPLSVARPNSWQDKNGLTIRLLARERAGRLAVTPASLADKADFALEAQALAAGSAPSQPGRRGGVLQ